MCENSPTTENYIWKINVIPNSGAIRHWVYVKRDLYMCEKRPKYVWKETYMCLKINILPNSGAIRHWLCKSCVYKKHNFPLAGTKSSQLYARLYQMRNLESSLAKVAKSRLANFCIKCRIFLPTFSSVDSRFYIGYKNFFLWMQSPVSSMYVCIKCRMWNHHWQKSAKVGLLTFVQGGEDP